VTHASASECSYARPDSSRSLQHDCTGFQFLA